MAWTARLAAVANRTLSAIENVVVLGCLSVALAIGTAQVVLRYAFNTGVHWSEAYFILFTVMSMLFAGSQAVRDDKHVGIDVLPGLLPKRPRKILRALATFASLMLCAYFAYCGLRYVLFLEQMGTIAPDTGLPDWVLYLLVPVTLGAYTLRYLIRLSDMAHGTEVQHSAIPDVDELEGRF